VACAAGKSRSDRWDGCVQFFIISFSCTLAWCKGLKEFLAYVQYVYVFRIGVGSDGWFVGVCVPKCRTREPTQHVRKTRLACK